MKTECEMLIAKQKAGGKLGTGEIRTLMLYALELLRDFRAQTQANIDRAHKLIGERYKKSPRNSLQIAFTNQTETVPLLP